MANPNILKTTFDGTYPDYDIPKKYKNEIIYLTTTTTLDAQGWNLDLIHGLNLNGQSRAYKVRNRAPDITRTELGTLDEIKDQIFSLISIATRFDGPGEVPRVNYKLTLEAGTELIEEFEIDGTRRSPTTFYTKATLKMSV